MYCGFDGIATLHVYTLIPDLNRDDSYMVLRRVDSFATAHHVREVANTVAVLVATLGNFENTSNFHES